VSDEADMERPVTRRELKEELGKFEARLDAKLDAKLDRVEAKAEFARIDAKIEAWGGALLARMDAMMIEMRADMARHTKAAMEWALEQFRAVDDKYADLPRRVTRLEGKVFPPRRARRR
jgi:hypothetical protein